MADESHDKQKTREQREKATEELFGRDGVQTHKDQDEDELLGRDHLELARDDVAMPDMPHKRGATAKEGEDEESGFGFREGEALEASASVTLVPVEAGMVVGILYSDDDTISSEFSYEISGDAADLNLFEIIGNQIVISASADTGSGIESIQEIRIQVSDDAGNSFTQPVTIDLEEINQAPVFQEGVITSIDEESGTLNGDKRVFDLVKDFGTSQSPKSTRSSTTY